MSGVRVVRVVLRLLAAGLTLALAALIALIVPSADNGPFMTPFALVLVALATVLVLLGYASGLGDAPAAPAPREEPDGERPD
jgi:peptidoglycan/LPS O-acetylase OafA/YrhL